MVTSEDYRQMANQSAQLAIGCAAPSVAQALLALALDYMAVTRPPRSTSTCARTLQASEINSTG
jgi:hypothetical protein